ncbi:MAG TPA: DUF3300 domain-containing protein [Vicinamibacterales bacterium]|nr:DUF3300 domain-containing protein [Vicinamibacterales bacterium]
MLQRSRTRRLIRTYVAVACTAALLPGTFTTPAAAQEPQAAASEGAVSIPPDQLDSLVSPVALYPDPLLAQVLAASTYPLELLQLHQWLQKNPGLKDKALIDAVSKQPWDPSIQAMAGLPDLVKRLTNDIQWTTDLGNAFLAQQNDVMDAVQRMRHKAQEKGTLASTPQQTVQTQVVEREQVIVIEQSDPEVIYVPEYDPVWAYGAPIYPYPPIYYPTGGLALGFGVGVAVGAVWGGGGGWGWGCRWGGDNDITINNNNNFNRNANIRAGNNNLSGRTNWQHRPEHRGGAPYRDRATANKYGGAARGDSLTQRQAGARQQVQRQGGNVRSGAVGTTGAGDRAGSLDARTGGAGDRAANRDPRTGGAGDRAATRDPRTGGVADRAGSVGDRGSVSDRGSFGSGSSADRIGSRDLGSADRGSGAFGSSGGFDGSKARSSSSRGGSSMRGSSGASRGGGGMSRGGGGSRGGGRR